MAAGLSTPFPQLTDTNFKNWKFRVLSLLDEKEVRWVVDGTEQWITATGEKLQKGKLADTKARNVIINCVTDRHIEYVKDSQTAADMLAALSNIFERKSTITKLLVRKQLLTLKCTTTLQEHFHRFDNLIRDLEGMGSTLDQDDKVCHLLLTLPERYENVITVLETMDADITLDFVKSRLLDAELKLNHMCAENNSAGETSFFSSRPVRKCYGCGDTRHLIADCPRAQNHSGKEGFRDWGNKGHRGRNQRFSRGGRGYNNSLFCSEDEVTFVATSEETVLTSIEGSVELQFVLDSGCTDHLVMPSLKQCMMDIQDIEHPVKIKVANGAELVAKQKGTVKLYKGDVKVNLEALIVPDLTFNLLSVKKVVSSGKRVTFSGTGALIEDDKGLRVECNTSGKLFMVDFTTGKVEKCCTAEVEDLWHKRLGHLNRNSLRLMGLPVSAKVCDSCRQGKANRQPFPSRTLPRSGKIGELLHTDVGGPVTTPTHNGERFFQTITDDYSHFCVVYLLKTKAEAAENLINYARQLESQFGTNCTSRVRCDNGGEFSSSKLKSFCTAKGIRLEYTAPYSPQMNGVSERLNRTLLDKVRAMFVETDLPKYLWGEAIRTAAYQLNRCPTAALNGEVPAKLFLGVVDLSKLRIFGAKAWAVKLPQRDKLAPRATPARMVGYGPSGYRVWDPSTDKVRVSRDVTFDEADVLYREEEQPGPQTKWGEELEGRNSNQQTSLERTYSTGESEDEFHGFEDENVQPLQRRSNRKSIKPKHLENYELYATYCLLSECNPQSYEEAVQESEEWQTAIQKELDAHIRFQTWTTAKPPKDVKPIETKWIFHTKQDGTKKARLVAKGFQVDGTEQVYAPVAKMPTIRLALSYSLQKDWSVKQLDVPTAFLNGILDSEVYIFQPKGVKGNQKVLKLQRALYGLRESPRCWNQRFNEFATMCNLRRSNFDACLYIGENVWLVVWVDDILLLGEKVKIGEVTEQLKKEFGAKDMGDLQCFIGTEISVEENRMEMCQQKLIKKILRRFNLQECKSSPTPMEDTVFFGDEREVVDVPYRELVGSLTYLSQMSRPDITFATSYLSRFLDQPTRLLWNVAKRVLRYVSGTIGKKLVYKKCPEESSRVITYADADWGGDKVDRKSVSGMASFHCGNLVSWGSKKQQVVALSSAEAEYTACSLAASELIYLKGLLSEFVQEDVEVTCCLMVDNQGAIHMMKNYENTKRSKHIDIKFHFLKDIVAKQMLTVNYVESNRNIADIFTKPLGSTKFCVLREKLCLT